jgi:hypothetical protein
MKRIAFLLVLAPVQAEAVPYTVLQGAEVPAKELTDETYPRYDIAALCKRAWPGNNPTTLAARSACETRQHRLSALTSHSWDAIPAEAKLKCVERADAAGAMPYYVLYTCVNAALFTVKNEDKAKGIANMIRKQNGAPPLDTLSVGSIK